MNNQQVPKADSKFQKIVRANHRKWKIRLLSKGGQKASSGGSPYREKPDYKMGKSAPDLLDEEEQLNEIIVKRGDKYCLVSKSKTKEGKRKSLGCYPSRSGALKREKQVQYFKHLKEEIIKAIQEVILNESENLEESFLEDVGVYGKKQAQGGGDTPSSSAYSPANFKDDLEFEKELNRVAQKFNVNAKELLAVMKSESGLNPQARNQGSGATGLIQFMPATAKALGTTTDELYKMNRAQQMVYVEKFFDMMKLPKGASGGMIYATIFLPGRRSRDVLTSQGEGYYNSNKGLDLDKNGDISMKDLDQRVANMAQGLAESKKLIIKFGEILTEEKKKDDRCVRIAKRKYKAWPSAYASGAVVKCRQGKIWKSVKEEGQELEEEWSEKYKKSIDCKNPKGFSQRAHCQGKKKNESIELEERKLGKPSSETNLGDWFKRKGAPGKKGGWVDCNTCHDGKCKPCGRQEGEKRSKYPRCRPTPSQCKGYKRRHSNLQREEDE
jgi:hypothetical protein